MADPADIRETADRGVTSVLGYLLRTAERGDVGVRWETPDYDGRPHYSAAAYNGVSGVTLFLTEYARLTGDREARHLAEGGLRWCSTAAPPLPAPGPAFGPAGLGMAWLRLWNATGDPDALAHARAVGDHLLRGAPGPPAGLLLGAAGDGLFLVRLWEAAADGRYLGGAVRTAEWLVERAMRDDLGCYWLVQFRGPLHPSAGLGIGLAGIGYFFLVLHQATDDRRWADLASEVAATLARHARPDLGGLNWPRVLGTPTVSPCQWCHGAPGIGLFFAKAHEVLRHPELLATAQAAGETTYRAGDVRSNPSQCHGVTGNAELFLELGHLTGAGLWLERAHEFAERALAYRIVGPQGDTWPADEPGLVSPDFGVGAAGVGHFFLRLSAPGRVTMPFL